MDRKKDDPTRDSPEAASVRALLLRYFEALQQHNLEALVACFHPEISFSDALFPNLKRAQVPARWYLFFAGLAPDSSLSISHDFVFVEERKAQVFCTLNYRRSDGKACTHRVLSTFSFWDQKIVRQVDGFNFFKWARQHLGWSAYLMGWSTNYRLKVQAAMAERLSQVLSAQAQKNNQ